MIRLIYPYGRVRRVMRGPARGMRFVVAPGIGTTYALGIDAAAPRHFARYIRPGMSVFDVGANKGQMSLIFAALVGRTGRVVAFEPAPDEFSHLARNIALNGLDQVRAIRAAASDRAGRLEFAYAPDQPTTGKLRHVEPSYVNPNAVAFSVDAVTLDEVALGEPMPDVIKVDVEGAAAAVLRGARRILDEGRPRIYIELHGPEEQQGVRDELISRGFVARTMTGEIVEDPTAGWHSPLWCARP